MSDTTAETPAPPSAEDLGITSELLTDLGIDANDFAYLAENPGAFVPTGKTTRFEIGQRTTFRGTLGDREVECIATINKASLTRVTVQEQEVQEGGRDYLIVSGMINPINIDISMMLTIAGQEREVPLPEFLRSLINANRGAANHVPYERFIDQLRNIGMRLTGDMVMFWQHMGADPTKTTEFIDKIKELGAVDETEKLENQGRIQSVHQFKGEGLPITHMEIGRADRNRSKTKQGFTDFLDAIVTSNFKRAIKQREVAKSLEKDLAAELDSLDDEQVRLIRTDIESVYRAARNWMNNVAGAQERIVVQPDETFTHTGHFDVVQAPLGRMTLLVPDESNEHGNGVKPLEIDLWKAPQSEDVQVGELDPSVVIDTTSAALAAGSEPGAEEEPF